MAEEMSLSKPFLKETKTSSLFCLRSEVLYNYEQRALSGPVGARTGITTGATLSGPSFASWFLGKETPWISLTGV